MALLQKWKRIGIIALSSGMTQLLSLIFGLLLVRVLSATEYAVYRQGMLLVNTLSPFFCILSPISLSYFFARAKTEAEKQSYVSQTVLALSLISLVGAVAVFALRNRIGQMYNNELLTQYMGFFAVILFVEASAQYFAYYMVCIQKEKQLVRITVLFSALRTLALVLVIALGKDCLGRFLMLYTLIELARIAVVLGYTRRANGGLGLGLNRNFVVRQVLFSLPVYAMGVINAVNANLDKNFVAMLYSPERYAIYENGTYQIPLVGILSSGVISVMLPDIARRFQKDDRNALDGIVTEYRQVIAVSFGLLFSLYVSLLAFSRGAVTVLFSEKYLQSLPVFRVYLLMLLFQALNLGVLLTSADRQWDIVKAGLIMLACNLGALLTIHRFGGFSALVWAPVLATLVMNGWLLYYIRKTYAQPSVWRVLPLGQMGKLLLPGAAVYGVFRWLQSILPMGTVVQTVLLGPICFGTMAAIAMGLIHKEKKEKLADENGLE